jgi:drug/metabolite transporter (DMT)-like permease
MGFGGGCSTLLAWQSGGLAAAAHAFGPAQWAAVISLGVLGGAAAFYLWVFALQRTTPTRVANTMTVNPIAASLLAFVLVGEPIGWNLLVGLAAIAGGIWIASTEPRPLDSRRDAA